MYKNKRRCIAVLLSIFILSGSVITSYDKAYATAEGIIVGGITVTVGEAIAFLLGAFGLTAASAVVYDNVDSIKAWGAEQRDNFESYIDNNIDQSMGEIEDIKAEVSVWFDNLCKGVVDISSVVWDYWRQWCGGLTTNAINHVGGVGSLPNYAASFDNADIQALMTVEDYKCDSPSYLMVYYAVNYGIRYVILSFAQQSGHYYTFYDKQLDDLSWGLLYTDSAGIEQRITCHFSTIYLDDRFESVSKVFGLNKDNMILGDEERQSYDIMSDFLRDYVLDAFEYALVNTGITDVYERDKDYDAVDWVNPGAVAGATDVVIDWGKVGDIAGVMQGVVAGDTAITDALVDANVTVIDRTTDKVIDDTGITDTPVTDVVVDTTTVDDYTMPGLESLFPFCLPFDLIAFLGVLQADPIAPHFKIPIKYPTLEGMAVYEVDIDLSVFDTVAALLRDMECLVFIIGLIILTRDKMIRG